MYIFEKLQEGGYKKIGNWYIHDVVSLNLFTKEIKSTHEDVLFSAILSENFDFEKVENIRKFIESFN